MTPAAGPEAGCQPPHEYHPLERRPPPWNLNRLRPLYYCLLFGLHDFNNLSWVFSLRNSHQDDSGQHQHRPVRWADSPAADEGQNHHPGHRPPEWPDLPAGALQEERDHDRSRWGVRNWVFILLNVLGSWRAKVRPPHTLIHSAGWLGHTQQLLMDDRSGFKPPPALSEAAWIRTRRSSSSFLSLQIRTTSWSSSRTQDTRGGTPRSSGFAL